MADKRINDPAIPTATEPSGDDYFIMDGSTNNVRNILSSDLKKSFLKSIIAETEVYHYTKGVAPGQNLTFTYTPTGDGLFTLKKTAYGDVETYDIYAQDSTGTNTQISHKTNVPFGELVELILPAGYDRWLFYKGTQVSTGIDISLFIIDIDSIEYKVNEIDGKTNNLESSVEDISKEFIAETEVYHYTKGVAPGQNLTFTYTPTGDGLFTLKKTAYGDVETYDIYAQDSTGTNTQISHKTNVPFGELVELILPAGYDRWLFYKGTQVSTGIDISLFIENVDTLAWKVDSVAGLDKEFIAVEEIRHFVKGAGADDRMSFYYSPNVEQCICRIDKNEYVGVDSYDVYLNDSSGVKPLLMYKPNVRFGELVTLKLASGYDRWLFYKQEKTTNKIDVTLNRIFENHLAGKLVIVNDKVDKSYPLYGLKVLCLGDSITQFAEQRWRYSDWLADISRANVLNAGIGGTRYSIRTDVVENPTTSNQAWAAIDMYNLVHSWLSNDFTTVDNAVQWLHDNESREYAGIVNVLKNNAVTDIDVITLFAGTNDYGAGALVGEVNNDNQKTILGALSLIVKELLTANPKLRIYIFSPIIRWFGSTRSPEYFSDVYERSVDNLTLKELASDICAAGKEIHIPTCDLYNTLGWNMWNFANYFPNNDNTHPQYGFKSIAKKMYAFILSNNN